MTDQTRADFEAHFQLTTRQKWQHPDGSYKFPEIQAQWLGYLAGVAKAAPVAEQEPIGKVCVFRDTADGDVFDIATTGEQRERIMQMDGMPIYAAPVAAAAPGAVQEPVEYQVRTRPMWRDEAEGWTEWRKCSPESYADYVRVPVLHDWQHETRALYAAPVAAAAPGAEPIAPLSIYEMLAIHDNNHGDWIQIARAVEDHYMAKLEAAPAADGMVPVPTSADQAHGMVNMGLMWLKEHAPHRLINAAPVAAAAPGAECKSCAILRRYEKTARERGYAMGKAAGDNELSQVQELLAFERKAHAETNAALTAEITRLEAQLAAAAPTAKGSDLVFASKLASAAETILNDYPEAAALLRMASREYKEGAAPVAAAAPGAVPPALDWASQGVLICGGCYMHPKECKCGIAPEDMADAAAAPAKSPLQSLIDTAPKSDDPQPRRSGSWNTIA